MAGQTTGMEKAFKVDNENGIGMYRGVTLTKAGYCNVPEEDNAIPLGVTSNDEVLNECGMSGSGDATGKHITVQLEGIGSIQLAEPVKAGELIKLGAEGLGKKGASTDNVLGMALADGDKEDVVPVKINIQYGA